MKKKSGQKPCASIKTAANTPFFFSFFFLQSLGSITRKKMVPSFLKLGSFMKQRP